MSEKETFLRRDDFIVGYRAQTGWGLGIALDFFFSGTGAALFLLSSLLHSPSGMILSLAFVAIGVLALFLDLGNPWRFYKAFSKIKTSWISRGSLFIMLLFVCGILWGAAGFPILSWPLAALFVIIAVLVMLYPGMVISYSPSITAWNSQLTPILLSLHSLASGLSILLILHRAAGMEVLLWVEVGILLFLLAGSGIYLAVSNVSSSGARESVELLTTGWARSSFFFLGIGVGIVLPTVLFLLFAAGGIAPLGLLIVAAVLRLIGDLGFRFAILKIGLYDRHI
jgi:sulfite dehydrogenase (quinone) subunit SoeC